VSPVATRSGLQRLERIADESLPPLPSPPVNPTVEEAMQAWMAMARAYGSIATRQHEFQNATIDVLKGITSRIDALAQDVKELRTSLDELTVADTPVDLHID
jgi:hypothetical protein